MANHKDYSGIRDEHGIWLSPLPVVHDFDLLGVTVPHNKSDTVLAVSAGDAYGFKVFENLVRQCSYGGLIIAIILIILDFTGDYPPEPTISAYLNVFSSLLICLALYAVLSPFLLFSFFKARRDYPVFFHRQRREVLFLRSSKPGYKVVPWEETTAVIESFFSFNQFWARKYSRLVIGVKDPDRPGQWWHKIKILGFNADHSRLNWCQICRYMDAHPDHFYPGSPELEEAYDSAKKVLPRFPDFVNEWLKPIPEAQWAKPSTKLRWYNSYLISLYEKNIGWAGIGRIEEAIGYPGDEEAAKQLEQGWLTPLPGADGEDYPSMPAGKQPAPPTGPPRDFRGEVIDLTPKKKRTVRQWIRYWTSKDEV